VCDPKKQQDKLQKQLEKSSDVTAQQSLQSLIERNAAAGQRLAQDEKTYLKALEAISQIIHPFTLNNH